MADAVSYICEGAAPERKDQVCHEIDRFMCSYRPVPKVFIAYDRTAFAGLDNPDLRITFDTNLRWRDTGLDLRLGDHGAPILPPGVSRRRKPQRRYAAVLDSIITGSEITPDAFFICTAAFLFWPSPWRGLAAGVRTNGN